MAVYKLNAKLIMRNDTEQAWCINNPILSKGEIGCSIDSDKGIVTVKIGDGVHPWNELELRVGIKEKNLEHLERSTSEAFKAIANAASKAGVSMSEAASAFHSIYTCGLDNAKIIQELQSIETLKTMAQEKQENKNLYLKDLEIPHYEFEDMDIKNLIDF